MTYLLLLFNLLIFSDTTSSNFITSNSIFATYDGENITIEKESCKKFFNKYKKRIKNFAQNTSSNLASKFERKFFSYKKRALYIFTISLTLFGLMALVASMTKIIFFFPLFTFYLYEIVCEDTKPLSQTLAAIASKQKKENEILLITGKMILNEINIQNKINAEKIIAESEIIEKEINEDKIDENEIQKIKFN